MMKTFSKRFLTMLLAVAMVFSLSGMTTFAAETDDADAQQAADADALSEAEESVQEETEPEPEIATLSADDEIVTLDAYEADYRWYEENPDADEFTIEDADDLVGLSDIVNGTASDGYHDTFEGKTITVAEGTEVITMNETAPTVTYTTSGNTVTTTVNDNGAAVFTPIGNADNPFLGTFDGNGCTISNLYVAGDTGYMGLFGAVGGTKEAGATGYGIVENFNLSGVVCSTNNGGDYVGGVCGKLNAGGTIQNIVSTVDVEAPLVFNVGGIVGFAGTPGSDDKTYEINPSRDNTHVLCCGNEGKLVHGYNKVGGIVGEVSATVKYCYNNSWVLNRRNNAKDGVGGITGVNGNNNTPDEESIIAYCYNTGTISNNGITDGQEGTSTLRFYAGIAGWGLGGDGKNEIYNCYNIGAIPSGGNTYASIASGIENAGAVAIRNNYSGTASSINNSSGATDQEKGIAVSDDNFKAGYDEDGSILKDLAPYFVADTSGKNGNYPILFWQAGESEPTLTGLDITTLPTKDDYNDEPFDPAGMVVTATYSNGTSVEIPCAYATATNYSKETVTLTLDGGYTYDQSAILTSDMDKFQITFDGKDWPVDINGGTSEETGEPKQNDDGQYELATVSDLEWFANQVNNETYDGHNAIDGILLADIDASASETFAPIGTYSSISYAGTFDGDGHTVTVNLSGGDSLGMFGYAVGATISNLTVDGTVTGTGDGVAGVVGEAGASTTITNCVNYANVTENNTSTSTCYVGGVLGRSRATSSGGMTIDSCFNYGTISSNSETGGIAGRAYYCTLTNCGNEGTVTGGVGTGGVTGYLSGGNVRCCYNKGAIQGSTSVGGVIGNTGGSSAITIDACYNTGEIGATAMHSVTDGCGGIVGYGGSTITCTNSFNTGTVNANYCAALIGLVLNDSLVISNAYYLNGTADLPYNENNTGKVQATDVSSKNAEEFMSLEFVDQMNATEENFKKGCRNPVFPWETVEHDFVNGVCTICGETEAEASGYITIIVNGEESRLSYDDIDVALADVPEETTFTYTSGGNENSVTAKFIQLSSLLGLSDKDYCSFTVTATDSTSGDDEETAGLPFAETYLYKTDSGEYRTAVNGGKGSQWVTDPSTIEVVTEHTWEDTVWTWDGYTSASATRTCSVCGTTQTAEVEVSSETTQPSVASNGAALAGITKYTATATFADDTVETDLKEQWITADGAINIVMNRGEDDPPTSELSYSEITDAVNAKEPREFTYRSGNNENSLTMPFVEITDLLGIDTKLTSFCCYKVSSTTDDYEMHLPTSTCMYIRDDTLIYRTAVNESMGNQWVNSPTDIEVCFLHSWGTPEWTWEDDYSEATVTATCHVDSGRGDEVCGKTETYTVETTSETTEPTATEPGETVYTATATFSDGQVMTDTKTVEIPAESADVVKYAVKIWGIGVDEDKDENKLALTFGPALGTNYTTTTKAACDSDYCIHNMSWAAIIAQCEEDPTVFENCMKEGCTKTLELTPNDLFNDTAVEAAEQLFTGDGVTTLDFLLNGCGSTSYDRGATWNLSTSGANSSNPANLYSASRIRATLNGADEDVNTTFAGDNLCNEKTCLLSCFPEELQGAIEPRKTVNAGSPTWGSSGNDKTTYDKLWLFTPTEVGYDPLTQDTTSGGYYDGGGTDYNIATTNSARYAYEFSTTSLNSSGARAWWTRARSISGSGTYPYYMNTSGTSSSNNTVTSAEGLSPCFCIGVIESTEEQPTVSDVKILTDLDDNATTKTYDGNGFTLNVSATTSPDDATVSFQWYKDVVAVPTSLMPSEMLVRPYASVVQPYDAITSTDSYEVAGNVSDTGTYTCEVTVTNGDKSVSATGTIGIVITEATQSIEFTDGTEVTKDIGDGTTYTNALTSNSVTYGALSYTSSDEDVAEVDENGEVTLKTAGTTTITVTAAGDEVNDPKNYDAASNSYELTVTDDSSSSSNTISYAVKIYGIQKDTYKDDDGNTGTAALTFGPATGKDYTNSYEECNSDYCIHNMTWTEIIDQCGKDPTVFNSCLTNGCTKAVELTPNDTIFNQTTVTNALAQNYSGDGVSALYNLLNSAYINWNEATSANLYSESRVRNTLIGSAAGSAAGTTGLCDSTTCLLSCFPSELQSAIVPRETVNSNSSNSNTAGDATTYDKLFLLSLREFGDTSAPSGDDGGGEAYDGVNTTAAERATYEFSSTSASSAEAQYSWTRSRYSGNNSQAYYMDPTGYGYTSNVNMGWCALSPAFCIAGTSSSEPTTESADVKYAVSIWGIQEDTYLDENGNEATAGLTFGPATGANYTSSSVSKESVVAAGGTHDSDYCIHDMDWDEIASVSASNPTAFEDCLKNGCTKAVDIALNDTIGGTKYPDMEGDGAGVLYNSIAADYRKWNADGGNYGGNTGGWPASRIRVTLNGDASDAGTYAGDNLCNEGNCLFSCLPTDLQSAIVAKAVQSGTVYNTQSEANAKTTYDKLWLFSGAEVYADTGTVSIIHPYEGTLYKRSSEFGITTSNFGGLVNYEETGNAHTWWLRTIPTSSTANANIIMATGDWTSHSVTGNSSSEVGFSFGFCMAGPETAAVETTDINVTKAWTTEEDAYSANIPESVEVSLLANGEEAKDADGNAIDALTLTAEDEWTGTFKDVPVKTESGDDITYTVEETSTDALQYFDPEITGDATGGFVITNHEKYFDLDEEILPEGGDPTTQETVSAYEPIKMEMSMNLPYMSGEELLDSKYTILFHDELDEGLVLDEDTQDFEVTINGLEVGDDYYTISFNSAEPTRVMPFAMTLAAPEMTDDCAFHVEVDLAALYDDYAITDDDLTGNTVLMVSFNADLEGDALAGNYTSTAWYQVYDKAQDVQYTSDKHVVTATTYGIEITKIDSSDNSPLAGATLGVYSNEGCTTPVQHNGEDYTLESDEDGKVVFGGLTPATYYVKETVAPSGYMLSDKVLEADLTTLDEDTYTFAGEYANDPGYITIINGDDTTQLAYSTIDAAIAEVEPDTFTYTSRSGTTSVTAQFVKISSLIGIDEDDFCNYTVICDGWPEGDPYTGLSKEAYLYKTDNGEYHTAVNGSAADEWLDNPTVIEVSAEHDWGHVEWTWTETESTDVTDHLTEYDVTATRTCGRCKEEESATVTVTKDTTATATQAGKTTYTATATFPDESTAEDTKIDETDAIAPNGSITFVNGNDTWTISNAEIDEALANAETITVTNSSGTAITTKFVKISDLTKITDFDSYTVTCSDENTFTGVSKDAYLYWRTDKGCYRTAAEGGGGKQWLDEPVTIEIIGAPVEPEAFAVYTDDNTLTFAYGEAPKVGGEYDGNTVMDVYDNVDTLEVASAATVPWVDVRDDVESVVFDESFKDVKPISLAMWFTQFKTATFSGLEYLDTSEVTSMNSTFNKCAGLTNFDASLWDTSKVTNMSYLFSGCTSLTELDVKDWDTSQVTNMYYMFDTCTGLTELHVEDWDTSSVIYMGDLFHECSALTSLDLSSWDTSSATAMDYMFQACYDLESVELSGWDTSSVTSMNNMFHYCSSLTSLDVSNWDTSSVTSMYRMFYLCSSLEELDLSGWDTTGLAVDDPTQRSSAVRNFANGCTALNHVKLGEKTDIFTKGQLVNQADQETWYDSPTNGNVASTNYLQDAEYPGEYWTYTEEVPTVTDVTITATPESKTYDGAGISLIVTATVDPEDAKLSYQWYKVAEDGTETPIDDATYSMYTTGPNVSDSGTYKCVVSATDDEGKTGTGEAEITVTIDPEPQVIAFPEGAVSKVEYDDPFTNPMTGVAYGTITYESSDEEVATVDENGKVTIHGVGYAVITATVAGDEEHGDNPNYTANHADYAVFVSSDDIKWEISSDPGTVTWDDEKQDYVDDLTYTGEDITLTVTLTYTEGDEEAVQGTGYQWYIYNTDTKELDPIDGETEDTLTLTGEDVNAGDYVYVCMAVVTYTTGIEHTIYAPVEVNIARAAQEISYAETAVAKATNDAAFTNPLNDTKVDTAGGATITYASSDESVATVDAESGEVTIVGAGEATITATASETTNYAEATASYTLTVTEPAVVKYAVKIWGIGHDTYKDKDGNIQTAGLTFGPATGANHLNDYVSRETVGEEKHESEFCIHDMEWKDIIEQSEKDPTVFQDCLDNGCTTSVELTPNSKLFNMTAVNNAAEQNYTGDGVSALHYLLNGTGSSSYTYNAIWNYSQTGALDSDPSNIYSRSRIRTTLTGDQENITEWMSTSGHNDYYGVDTLCDENNCLLSCFPEELREAVVPRTTLNSGNYTQYANDVTTYDKLFLFSMNEMGYTDTLDDGGGVDYGIFKERDDRVAYEYSNVNASASTASTWWLRSRDWASSQSAGYQVSYVATSGGRYLGVTTSAQGLAPGFCLAGPVVEEPTVSDVKVTATPETKTYDGTGISLTATATVEPENAEVSYQWYKVAEDGTETAINGATYSLYTTGANVADSGTYKCVVTAKNSAGTATGEDEAEITITKAEQRISYGSILEIKYDYEENFTNELTKTVVDPEATFIYDSSDPDVATVDENGEVTLRGPGYTIITATAKVSDTSNYEEASAAYTLIVNEDLFDWEIDVDHDRVTWDDEKQEYVDDLTYTGKDMELEMEITLDEEEIAAGAQISYQWYVYVGTSPTSIRPLDAPTGFEPIEGANDATLTLTDKQVNAGDYVYMCEATISYGNEYAHTIYGAIEVIIEQVQQQLSYELTNITKTLGDKPFTNMLTSSNISDEEGGGITYSSSNTDVATVDENTGEVTLAGAVGTTTITATAEGTTNYEKATASYTLTVNEQDKDVLNAAIETALGLNEEDFTADSWSKLETALAAAQQVAAQNDATQEAIDDAAIELISAIANLEGIGTEVNKTDLLEAYTEASDLSEEDYTADSWVALRDALGTAQEVLLDVNATQDDVDKALEDLESAVSGLVDISELNEAIAEAEALDEDDYTTDSWAALTDALAAAQEVAVKPEATQEEVAEALATLETAMDSLVERGDKTDLDNAIAEAEALNAEDYTADSWAALTDALDAAQKVADDEDATQDDIDKALEALESAMDDLVNIADLNDAIAEADALNEGDYTKASWEALEEALEAAQTVAENPSATQEDVDKALEALESALDGLVKAADKDVLNTAIETAEGLDKDDYTVDSWTALQTALEAAQAVADQDDATQEDVDEAANALISAIANLKGIGTDVNKTDLLEEYTAASELSADDYTADSWAPVAAAIEDAQDVLLNVNASQDDVDKALEDLESALGGLVSIADLNDAIAEANALDKDDYTDASWADLVDALAAAQDVADDPSATQEEVDAAKDALESAMDGLVKLGDKTDLNNAIAEADALDKDDYTDDSWAALEDALEDAQAVADDPQATQADVDEALEALESAMDGLVHVADKDVLNAAIETALGLNESDYTPESWAKLTEALTPAQEVAEQNDATQEAVDAAAIELIGAIANLEPIGVPQTDKTGLLEAYTQASKLSEDEYTPESWEDLAAALADAQDVLLNVNATQEEVDAAKDALDKAMEDLVKVVDKSALNSAIEEAEALDKDDYTDASWAALEDALAAAQKVADDSSATQEEVDAALAELQSAMDGLVKVADKEVLNTAIATAEALNEDDYTPESWADLVTALETAQEVAAEHDATQEAVDAAANALISAIAKLQGTGEGQVDKTELLEEYIDASELSEEDYTPESWADLATAMAGAQAVLLNVNATQEEVDDAKEALENAVAGLVRAVDKSALDSAIEEAEALDKDDYTTDSWEELEKALTDAQDVADDPSATQEEVDAAKDALESAIDGLVKRGDKTELDKAIEEADALDKDDYTDASWAALEDALADAQDVADNPDATQEEVDAALEELESAMEGLVKLADKDVLNAAIETALGLNEEAYTEGSWSDLVTALAAAQEVAGENDATQEAVDAAAMELISAIANLEPVGVPQTDKTELLEAYTQASDLSEDDYTADSWAPLAQALADAQEVLLDVNATQEEVDAAKDALVEAMEGLVKVADKDALEAAIEEAGDLDKDDYTDASWAALEDALADAQDVMDNPEATQEDVDAALAELESAMDSLVKVADKDVLNNAIEIAEGLNEEDYTPESWTDLVTALAAAQEVAAEHDATQEAVDAAANELISAIASLQSVGPDQVDKNELLEEYIADSELSEEDYTPESWTPFAQALADAQEVLLDVNATQEDVDDALAALKEAAANLQPVEPPTPQPTPVVDKEVLESAIDDALALTESDYTPDTWAALQTALEAAQKVDADEDATQDDVNAATIDLVSALANLQFAEEPPAEQPDKTDLLNEYVEGMKLNESDYTPESWEPFAQALADAQSVLTDPDATQDDVDAAEQALKTAMDNLEKNAPVKNGLCRIEAGKLWGYYVDDVVDETYTGFASNENGDWWVVDGYVRFDVNSVEKDPTGKNGDKGVNDKGTWWYVVGNKVQHDFTGLANYKNANGWWYIKDGKVDFSHNGVDKNKNGWYYVMNGKVRFDFTGLSNYKNENGWWYIAGGKVDFTHNGVDKNQNGWYYVLNGKVRFDYTGVSNYKNANGWWYIKNGRVDFSFTGKASNKNGTWNVVNGKVVF